MKSMIQRWTRFWRRSAAIGAVALLGTAPASAQLPTSAVRGLVTDAQQGILPGATVTATEVNTGAVRTVTANAAGAFRLAGLAPGRYQLIAELAGFSKHARTVDVALTGDVEVNFTLPLEGRVEEVTVVAESPMVETSTSQVSRTFQTEQIRDLPLPNRNFLNLMLNAPGVVTGGTGAAGFGVSVNGQRSRNVNFVIDGSDNNDASVPNPRAPIMQDAVGEFRLVTSTFSAEFGRNTGAVALATTRAGTNAFHGTAYEFYENAEKLNTRDNLEIAAGFERPGKLRRDTYGLTLGGPLQRNRMFFFTGFQHTPFEGAGAAVPIGSPTAEGRQLLRSVPGASSVMLDLLERLVPAPNAGNLRLVNVGGVLVPFGDYVATLPNSSENVQLISRVDRTLSSTDTAFLRYIRGKTTQVNASNPPGFGSDVDFPSHNLVATWNRILGPSMVNEFHYSYGRTKGAFPAGASNPAGNNEMPTLTLNAFFTLGLAINLPQDRKEQVHQFTDSLSWLRGNHALKFGADVRRVDQSSFVPFDFRGTYIFQNVTQFVTNRPFSTAKVYGDPGPVFDFIEAAYFVQDDWKPRPSLTLNLGLRYERTNASQGFYSNVKTDNNNFGPRAGLAWDLTGDGRTVIRGGYALTYDQLFLNIPLLAQATPPYQRRITDLTSAFGYPNLPGDRAISDAELLTLGATDIPDDAQNPMAHQWQVGLQRQLGAAWRLEAAYIGSLGRNLIRQRIENPVFCCPRETVIGATGVAALRRYGDPRRTGQITILEPAGQSEFHSGQFSVDRRFANGFSLSTAYTWSRFMDDNSEALGTGQPTLQRPQNNFDFDAEWSRSAFDRPHRLVVTWNYELPFLRTQDGLLGRTLGGWQLSGNWAVQSGQPFTIITGVDSNGDGDTQNDRPNVNPGGDPKTIDGYIFRGAFSGGDGNLGRNTGRGPHTNQVNTVFFKNVRTHGAQRLQLRIEVFNLLNRRNYVLRNNGADRNLSNPSQFYTFTSSNGGNRAVILGAKYLF